MKNWFFTVVMPILLGLWLYTGHVGFYNVYATCVIIGFIALIITGALLIAILSKTDAIPDAAKFNDEMDKTKVVRRVSLILAVIALCILAWHGKFIIAGLLVANMLLTKIMQLVYKAQMI